MELSCDQRESVTQEKTAVGFLDVGTPPPGFTLNDKGRAMISTPLVRSIQENTSNYKFNSNYGLVPLTPLLGTAPPIPPMFITEANSSEQYFVKRGKPEHTLSDSSSIFT